MIVQSLCRYYDILAEDNNSGISKPCCSRAKVSFALGISSEGNLSNIIDLRIDGKKPQPKLMDVPYQKSRTNKVTPYFLCDKAEYIFGVERVIFDSKNREHIEESDYISVLEESEDSLIVVSERSLERFNQFRNLHHGLLDNINDSSIKIFLKYLDTWEPKLFLQYPKIKENKEDILTGNMVFEHDCNYLHEIVAVKRAWQIQCNSDSTESGDMIAQCLVDGRLETIARLHQKVIGVYNAQASGASLVSFNDDSFYSYGKTKSFNAPFSKSSMIKYTTVLNYLLSHESKNKLRIDDTTIVFWAETHDNSYVDLTNFLINPREHQVNAKEENPGVINKPDKDTNQLVRDIFAKVRLGQPLKNGIQGIDLDKTRFYILGLAPNNARIAVRFWYQDSFGNFIINLSQHYLDMEIVRGDSGPQYVSPYRLLKETVAQSSKDTASSPLLDGLLMRAILGNTPYPFQLYTAMVSRARVEGSINHVRAGFIKAYLLRLTRFGLTDLKEEMITISLNEESSNVPYRLGRLFAVLEKTQNDTNRDMKSTINSKYFSSASTTPAVVFPVLLKLAQHHISKSDWGFKSNQSIEDILIGIDNFPPYLNQEDQGMFMLGYYHQRKAFFKKKESSQAKEDSE